MSRSLPLILESMAHHKIPDNQFCLDTPRCNMVSGRPLLYALTIWISWSGLSMGKLPIPIIPWKLMKSLVSHLQCLRGLGLRGDHPSLLPVMHSSYSDFFQTIMSHKLYFIFLMLISFFGNCHTGKTC